MLYFNHTILTTGKFIRCFSFAEEERVTMRPSKSDTSLTDGFVMIDNDKHRGEHYLKKGKSGL